MTITEFLLARLAEDEAVAQAAANASLTDEPEFAWHRDSDWTLSSDDWTVITQSTRTIFGCCMDEKHVDGRGIGVASSAEVNHIARHDPARALREVAAKRRMVELCEQWPIMVEAMDEPRRWLTTEAYRAETGRDWPSTDPMIRALASVYSDHEDWREEWA